MPVLSTLYSTLPALLSDTARDTSIVAVPSFGFGISPRGLMPNPKLGTATMDVSRAVSESKAGKVEYKVDKTGIVHASIGKKSFGAEKLLANASALLEAILRAKPSASKGAYLKK